MSEEKGFLTEVDRAFLTGEKEYTGDNAKQLRYQRRQAIAERTRQAFHDFSLLFDVLDEHERDRIFNVTETTATPDEMEPFYNALVDTVAFLYLSLEGEVNSDSNLTRSFSKPFDSVLSFGVKRGEKARHTEREHLLVTIDFEVDVDYTIDLNHVDHAIDKLARREHSELTEREMFAVLTSYEPDGIHGEDSYTRLADRIRERRDELGIDTGEPLDVEELFGGE